MYSYTYDDQTGGILLNSSPVVFSKEPRPVYSAEMNLLGFSEFWSYVDRDDAPYMWAESNVYFYRGTQIAKISGGDLYHKPELSPIRDDTSEVLFGKDSGYILETVDIKSMCEKNRDFMTLLESASVKRIIAAYEKHAGKLDIFHVAFSGGKDSIVLLELVERALPVGSYVVIFGDTGMEFPDTYDIVNKVKIRCEEKGISFYTSSSHFNPKNSWSLFGPPARVLRWCCSVHKSAPQTLKMREITGKDDYVGMDFVGVRKFESLARSRYDYENYGKKQRGQYSYYPILEWTSAEVWLYIYANDLPINEAYVKGNPRIGCLFCPMGGGKNDYVRYSSYHDEVEEYVDIVKSSNVKSAGDDTALCSYIINGGWNARKSGRDLKDNAEHYRDEVLGDKIIITVTNPRTSWREWLKTIGEPSFRYDCIESDDGFKIVCSASVSREYPGYFKLFKQVFKKAAHCVNCRVCEANCRKGAISFVNGDVSITDCVHCGQCHDIDDGCLAYHSLFITKGDIMESKSIDSFGDHAPKPDWVRNFFDLGNNFWEHNQLGPKQIYYFKRFLREAGLVDSKFSTTRMFEILSRLEWDDNSVWGIIIANLSYNVQCRWYIENMDVGKYYDRNQFIDMLELSGVKNHTLSSLIEAFKRFCDLPMGQVANWGYVEEDGRQVAGLSRTRCSISDNRVLLYAIYLFAEKCDLGPKAEMHLSYLFDEETERTGISPVRMFGLYDEKQWETILLGLSSKYPDFIYATFTNDLKSFSLGGKTSADVLELFEEV